MWNLVVGVLLALGSSSADCDRYELYELVATAERVVSGTITEVRKSDFDLSVEEVLLGNVEDPVLRLNRFVDRNCAGRWNEYRVGQRVLVFLRGNRAMGRGNEGDWPLVEGKAFAPYRVRDVEQTSETFDGRRYLRAGTPIPLLELASSIRGYRTCFETWREELRRGMKVLRLRFAVSSDVAEEYARSSTLSRHLFDQTISSRAFVRDDVPQPSLDVVPTKIRASAEGFALPSDPEVAGGMWSSDSLESIGDLDGDGWDDLAALAVGSGLWILFMDAKGNVHRRRELTTEALGIQGASVAGLAALGDVNEDGVPDLFFGALWERDAGSGRGFVLLLDREGGVRELRELHGDPTRESFTYGLRFGVAAVRDRDRADAVSLVVRDESYGGDHLRIFEQFGLPPPPSAAFFLRADASGVSSSIVPLDKRDFDAADLCFGGAVSGIGDLDGDGLSEVAIGIPDDDDGGWGRGALWILFFHRDGTARAKTKISDWSGGFDELLFDGDRFGESVAGAGDLDGDRVPDLVVAGDKKLWVLFLHRDGTVKSSRAYGGDNGGFVPVTPSCIQSVAVRHGPGGTRQLIVGVSRVVVWVLTLGSDGSLSAP